MLSIWVAILLLIINSFLGKTIPFNISVKTNYLYSTKHSRTSSEKYIGIYYHADAELYIRSTPIRTIHVPGISYLNYSY